MQMGAFRDSTTALGATPLMPMRWRSWLKWPWTDPRRFDCGNGRTRLVYRDVNNVFPLYLADLKSNTKAAIDAVQHIKGQISQEHQETVKTLLFKIDEKNSSAQTQLRAAYIVYSAAPCEKLEYLESVIDQIRTTESQMKAVEMYVGQMVSIVKTIGSSKTVLQNTQITNCLDDALSTLAKSMDPVAIQMSRINVQMLEWQRGGA
jgi:hypothetical protein